MVKRKPSGIRVAAVCALAMLLVACGKTGPSTGPAAPSSAQAAPSPQAPAAAPAEIHVAWFGAMSGVLRSFGHNSGSVFDMVIKDINAAGGVRLADGRTALLKGQKFDTACNPEQAIAVTHRMASGPFLLAIGPTCSSEAEPVFGILQKRLDDPSDTGLQFPIFTDVAIKVGLAAISPWAFRNVGNENVMYDGTFKFIREKFPDVKTIAFGVESDFAHSKSTWQGPMTDAAKRYGFQIVENQEWHLTDTEFSSQVRRFRAARPDVIAISAHPFTTCGVLREMRRQGVKPKVLVGLTSSATSETLLACSAEAEGMLIPTTFAPVDEFTAQLSERVFREYNKANLDLHSAPVYENLYVLKDLILKAGIEAKPETLQKDRRRIRDALETVGTFKGLLGPITMGPDGDVDKPWMVVQARNGKWVPYYDPRKG